MVKITAHADGKFVVNTPGSHLQRRPRVYRDFDRAVERARRLVVVDGNVGRGTG